MALKCSLRATNRTYKAVNGPDKSVKDSVNPLQWTYSPPKSDNGSIIDIKVLVLYPNIWCPNSCKLAPEGP